MKNLIVASILIWAASVIAQTTGSMNGKWSAKFALLNGNPAEVTVMINEPVGSWQSLGQSPNPCVGRKFPMDVQVSSADSAVLKVHGSKVMNGCDDLTLEFKRTGPNSFESQFPDGRKIILSR